MLTYQFDMMNNSGARSCFFVTECEGDREAVSLAAAILTPSYGRIKVWRADVMIHDLFRSRPH